MQPGEYVFGQVPRGVLPDTFEYDVAQVVESDTGKAAERISKYERHCDSEGGLRFAAIERHRIDGFFIGKR